MSFAQVTKVFASIFIVIAISLIIAGAVSGGCDGTIITTTGCTLTAISLLFIVVACCEALYDSPMAFPVFAGVYGIIWLMLMIIGGILTAKGDCLGKGLLVSGGCLFGYAIVYALVFIGWFSIAFRDVDKVPRDSHH